ncbi:MAG: hypothetical protein M1834_002885 [Cirrosporium novae-zelandiae]|nr:MAG: hypothetical protein M1834_002885 [Cirrosporium novae-zelandiae]
MGSKPLIGVVDPQPPKTWNRINIYIAFRRLLALPVLSTILLWHREILPFTYSPLKTTANNTFFSWEDYAKLQPSKSLEYHPCFDGFQCARLEVPLDWNATEPDGNPPAIIAITRKPAEVELFIFAVRFLELNNLSEDTADLQKGGPGGSGVDFVLRDGHDISTIVNGGNRLARLTASPFSTRKYFDVMSFDPRGVNNTTPRFSCFPDQLSQRVWEVQKDAIGLLGSSNVSFDQKWSHSVAFSSACSNNPYTIPSTSTINFGHVGEYLNTAPVVRDMIEIIERHGEWRETMAQKLLANTFQGPSQKEAILERTAWRKEKEQLFYWGFSYGTMLGQTFASMYPDRVGKLVLDGVVDPDDYAVTGWSRNLDDTDQVLEAFYSTCSAAGLQCAIGGTRGIEGVRAIVEETLEHLKQHPLPVQGRHGPAIITHSDLVWLMFGELYSPIKGFPKLARLLADITQGNGTAFAEMKESETEISCPSSTTPQYMHDTGSMAVLCGDGYPSRFNQSQVDFKKYWNDLQSQSALFADAWARITLSCIGWSVVPKWRYGGSYGGTLSGPILFASETFDPVTPLQNARKMSEKFSPSSMIEQSGFGHCTLAMPSGCTAKIIREFFQTGEMPSSNTVCPVDVQPFVGNTNGSLILEGDEDLSKALMRIAQNWRL